MSSSELKQMGLTRASTRLQRKENMRRYELFAFVVFAIACTVATALMYGRYGA